MFSIRCVKINDAGEARRQIERIGSDKAGVAMMFGKTVSYNLKIHDLKVPQANILKQEMLAIGGDTAVAREVLVNGVERSDVLVMGTLKQMKELARRLLLQPFSMKKLSAQIHETLEHMGRKEYVWKIKGREVLLGRNTLVMGIVNVTPDSFSDGGVHFDRNTAIEHALAMINDGADIIDIGGESTRPGAAAVSEEEEKNRVLPVIEAIRKKNKDIIISIDTTKSGVADSALKAGADLINDISGLLFDEKIRDVAVRHKAGLILMHTRGTPGEMQKNLEYKDFMKEVLDSLRNSVDKAIEAGVDRESIVIDPGIGFAKSFEHNLFIIKNLEEFKTLGLPVLLGPSRKAFIGKITGKEAPLRDDATMSAVAAGVANGATIVRVHDVKKAKDVVRVADAIKNAVEF